VFRFYNSVERCSGYFTFQVLYTQAFFEKISICCSVFRRTHWSLLAVSILPDFPLIGIFSHKFLLYIGIVCRVENASGIHYWVTLEDLSPFLVYFQFVECESLFLGILNNEWILVARACTTSVRCDNICWRLKWNSFSSWIIDRIVHVYKKIFTRKQTVRIME